jgi:hypothetical protein
MTVKWKKSDVIKAFQEAMNVQPKQINKFSLAGQLAQLNGVKKAPETPGMIPEAKQS